MFIFRYALFSLSPCSSPARSMDCVDYVDAGRKATEATGKRAYLASPRAAIKAFSGSRKTHPLFSTHGFMLTHFLTAVDSRQTITYLNQRRDLESTLGCCVVVSRGLWWSGFHWLLERNPWKQPGQLRRHLDYLFHSTRKQGAPSSHHHGPQHLHTVASQHQRQCVGLEHALLSVYVEWDGHVKWSRSGYCRSTVKQQWNGGCYWSSQQTIASVPRNTQGSL